MILIKKVLFSDKDISKCFDIRYKVFVEEQNVPLSLEQDGKDKDCDHFLISDNNKPIGTARVRYVEDYAKIERVAILNAGQGKGFGAALMKEIIAVLSQNLAIKKAKLSSQVQVIPFYEKLGFKICSQEYMDAGIAHKDMDRNLP